MSVIIFQWKNKFSFNGFVYVFSFDVKCTEASSTIWVVHKEILDYNFGIAERFPFANDLVWCVWR